MGLISLIRKIYPSRGLDINRLISNIEKYLGKDLKFSMREFKQLQSLKGDVLKLEEIMARADKDQFALLEHYKAHAREIERYSERIERKLNVWVRRLESLVIIEEQNLTAGDKRYFNSWVKKVDICRNTLIKILARNGELHKLINEESPDWKKIRAKINEALGDNQHPGLRTLIVLFQQLKQVEKRLGDVSSQKITQEEYQKRLERLKEWRFPAEKEPRLADFLIKHWVGTVEMAKAADYRASYLFENGLPAVKDLINERTWPGMVEMAKAAGRGIGYLFQSGLPAVKDLINERTWPMIVEGFVEMAKAAGDNARDLFLHGLPAVRDLINERTWPGMVEMAKAAGSAIGYLFEVGLPKVKDIINERTWPGMVEMVKAVGPNAMYLFWSDLPAINYNLIKSDEDWKIFVKFIVSIAPSRQKINLFRNMDKIPPSAMKTFSDFILMVMDKQPARMLNIIAYVRALAALKVSIRNEILQFARIVGAFRLNPREYPPQKVKQNIRNTYIFLAQQTGKKDIDRKLKDLDRDIEKLSNSNASIRKATIDNISKVITPLIVEYLGHVTTNKFEEAWHSFTGIGLNKDIEKKHFDDLLFALQVAIKNNLPEAKLFLEQVSLGNFYPEKNIPNCFPYNQQKSMAFIAAMQSKGVNMAPWLYGFEKTLPVQSKAGAEHQAELIEQNVQEALQHFKELGVETTKEHMEEAFEEIRNNPNRAIVKDIQLHLHTIKSLEGGIRAIKGVTTAKVYIELNPLKVLQMGEKVSGSCLALNGGHEGDTITNAIDINKRVAWAEHNGQTLGRVLLAMNDDGEILRYRVYYALTGIDLENTFNAFVKELAEACHTKTSTKENVSLILASHWYAGSQPE